MHILIVCRDLPDPSLTETLKSAWNKADVSVVTLADLTADSFTGSDTIVVIGARGADGDVPLESLSLLTNLMLDTPVPVIAVGWGFEVACLAAGDDLTASGYGLVDGAAHMVPTSKGEALFQGSDPIRAEQNARWDYDELPRGYVALARSDTGIEAFQSKKNQLLAIQLLPADFTYPSDAKLVYQNLITAFAKAGKRA